jgi:hypothetical protein
MPPLAVLDAARLRAAVSPKSVLGARRLRAAGGDGGGAGCLAPRGGGVETRIRGGWRGPTGAR